MALTDTQKSEHGYTSNFNKEPMVGKIGTTQTILRPSGRVIIDNVLYDAYTRGEYIEKDTAVEVVSEEGSTLKVKSYTA